MLLSRVAENVYWSARYLERAEASARVRFEIRRGAESCSNGVVEFDAAEGA